ncbi:unnamed protein product [Soboliphyme baturini]|uniref:NADH-quinone oxidoreductase subunit I n=1 Tax=Soboliphyme baturini TaxID=241478 RepID=A0A183J8T2_9BILA|nr:unnamed protein product [Soboliphyme baturini]
MSGKVKLVAQQERRMTLPAVEIGKNKSLHPAEEYPPDKESFPNVLRQLDVPAPYN